MQTSNQKAAVIAAGQGRKFNVLGHSITAILAKQNTGGNYYVFECITPPGLGIPPHVHEREDELIYVASRGKLPSMRALKNDTVAEFAVDACVKKRNFFESIGIAAIGKTSVVWLRIDMDAYGAFAEFGKVKYLMYRLLQLYFYSKTV